MSYEHVFERATDPRATATLLLLHGTGGDQYDLLPLGRLLAPGHALLSPLGNVPEHGAPRFFRRLREGVFDEADVIQRAADLADFVASAATQYAVNPARVIAVGFSNGANIAAAVLLRHPGVLSAAVLLAPMVPLSPAAIPAVRQPTGTQVFLGAGRADPIAPAAQVHQLASILGTQGADVTVEWHAGGHQLTQGMVTAASQWLAPIVAPFPTE